MHICILVFINNCFSEPSIPDEMNHLSNGSAIKESATSGIIPISISVCYLTGC